MGAQPAKTLAPKQAREHAELWSIKEVEQVIGLRKPTVMQLASAGQFPKPLVILREKSGKPRKYAWRATEVRAWIEDRANER
mgnify:CR=1 FL=1